VAEHKPPIFKREIRYLLVRHSSSWAVGFDVSIDLSRRIVLSSTQHVKRATRKFGRKSAADRADYANDHRSMIHWTRAPHKLARFVDFFRTAEYG
jgi:hypothetical protein